MEIPGNKLMYAVSYLAKVMHYISELSMSDCWVNDNHLVMYVCLYYCFVVTNKYLKHICIL